MRRYPHRSLLRAVAPLIVAGTFTLAAAAAAAGLEPAKPPPIPESAFAPVTLPNAVAGSLDAPADLRERNSRLPIAPPTRPDLTAGNLAALAEGQPERAQPKVRKADRIVVEVPPPKPVTTHVLRGPASWYCRAGVSPCTYAHPDGGGFDAYAAAGPKLRAAIGRSWRGATVLVDGIQVRLVDWCQCYRGEPHEKLLDLYYDVYQRAGGSVTIRW